VTWAREFVDFDPAVHDRDSFQCDRAELNDFLKTRAAKHAAAGISRTIVLPAAQPLPNGKLQILAFFSIAPSSIRRDTLPDHLRKKLPHYPVPVFLLAQLAIHQDHQGAGLGAVTLAKSLETFAGIRQAMPAYAVVVDCIDERAESFYRKYDFETLGTKNGRASLFLPMNTVLRLFDLG
jgi:GNAT superfamily N-acetyltransferase